MTDLQTNNKLSMRMIRYYLPAMGWIILILFLCTLPGSAIPGMGLFDKLHIDMVAHLVLFGGTVMLLAYGYYRQRGSIGNGMLALIVLAATLYGLAIEFIQKYLVANRSFDMYDLLADAVGAVLGALVFSWIGKRFLK